MGLENNDDNVVQPNGAMGWEAEIEKESSFVELPAGDYDFVIDHFDRAFHNGSEKIPPCNKAIVYFNILTPDGSSVQIRESYILHTSLEWKLSELFRSVGLKGEGERIVMAWNRLPGLNGHCEVTLDADKNDPTKKYNHIKKLYPKELKKWQDGFR